MLCGNYILSNRSEWTFYFLLSVQFNFIISEKDILLTSIVILGISCIVLGNKEFHFKDRNII